MELEIANVWPAGRQIIQTQTRALNVELFMEAIPILARDRLLLKSEFFQLNFMGTIESVERFECHRADVPRLGIVLYLRPGSIYRRAIPAANHVQRELLIWITLGSSVVDDRTLR